MLDPDERVNSKTELCRLGCKFVFQGLVDGRSSCQKPEIFGIGPRNEGILIVCLVKLEDHIGAVKWSEKRDLQVSLRRIFYKKRPARSLLPFFQLLRVAAVGNPNGTVRLKTVICCYSLESALE